MASELLISASIEFAKDAVAPVGMKEDGFRIDITGNAPHYTVQNVGAAEEALGIGDLGTPGYILIRNLDPTNFVTIRAASGEADVVKILPGAFALFQLAAAAPYIIADTAACDVEYFAVEI